MVREKTEIEQAWAGYQKALRARIRLKYALRADAEINREVAKAQLAFEKSVQKGILPAPADILKALDA